MDNYMVQYGQTTEPKTEIVKDPFTIELCIADVIRLIQKNERGRQGRYRMLFMQKTYKKERLEYDLQKKVREGLIKEQTND